MNTSQTPTPPEAETHKAPADAGTAAAPATPTETLPETLPEAPPETIREIGGPKGLEPTRYGDWEQGGRCTDF
jgi:hypothetical protein